MKLLSKTLVCIIRIIQTACYLGAIYEITSKLLVLTWDLRADWELLINQDLYSNCYNLDDCRSSSA